VVRAKALSTSRLILKLKLRRMHTILSITLAVIVKNIELSLTRLIEKQVLMVIRMVRILAMVRVGSRRRARNLIELAMVEVVISASDSTTQKVFVEEIKLFSTQNPRDIQNSSIDLAY
jgi:hypothetical protein